MKIRLVFITTLLVVAIAGVASEGVLQTRG
jgi:hypothetical protein